MSDGGLEATLAGHRAGVSDCAWSGGSDYLASASDDKTVALWHVASRKLVHACVGHTAYVFCVNFNPQSNQLARPRVGSASARAAPRLLWGFPSPTALPLTLARPARAPQVSGSFDETVRLWEARSGRCIAVLPAHSDPVTAVAFSHDGTLVVSASYDGARAPCVHAPSALPACARALVRWRACIRVSLVLSCHALSRSRDSLPLAQGCAASGTR